MKLLPIKTITEEDVYLVGRDLFNLAKLSRFGFPVVEGIAVLPPADNFLQIFKKFEIKDKETFEVNRQNLFLQVLQINPHPELSEFFSDPKGLKKTWTDLLSDWFLKIESKIVLEGDLNRAINSLPAAPVMFSQNILGSGIGFVDDNNEIVVEIHEGKLDAPSLKKLKELIAFAKVKLLLPQEVYWILDSEGVKFIKLKPFTHTLAGLGEEVRESNLGLQKAKKVLKKTGVKLIQELSSNFSIFEGADGLIVPADSSVDIEEKTFRLVEAAMSLPSSDVFFKLTDLYYLKNNQTSFKGTALHLNNPSLLRADVDVFLFARNKKRLFNVSLLIPPVRGVHELLQIKRDLASFGVSRKGTLKMFVEIAYPENIINIDSYLETGIDGLFLNLDLLNSALNGEDFEGEENGILKKHLQTLINFLDKPLKKLHKSNIPFIISGSLASDSAMLRYFVDLGVWGAVLGKMDIEQDDFVSFLEKQAFL